MYKIFIKSFFFILYMPLFCNEEQRKLTLIPASKNFYQSFNNLSLDLQLYTLQFLMHFETNKDAATGNLIITRDTNVLLQQLQKRIEPANLFNQSNMKYIKDSLRSEYYFDSILIAIQSNLIHQKKLKPNFLCLDTLVFEALSYYHDEDVYDNHGNTKQDYLELAALLIANGALVNKKKNDVFHALHKAAKYNSVPVVQLLTKGGVKKSNIHTTKDPLDSALHIAAKHNSIDVIYYLNSLKENLNDQNRSGQTALHKASKYRHQKSIDLLLQLGADPTIKNNYGQTYLSIPKLKK